MYKLYIYPQLLITTNIKYSRTPLSKENGCKVKHFAAEKTSSSHLIRMFSTL